MAHGDSRRKKTKTGKRRNRQLIISGIVALVIFGVAALATLVPSFGRFIQGVTGIRQVVHLPSTGQDAPVAVHIVDVGQGDAVLLAADGEYALIDAGPPEAADDLVAYLEAVGVQRLRYLFMTHPHADHIGGMRAVMENFGVDALVLPDFELGPMPTTSLFEGVVDAATDRHIHAATANYDAVYPLGPGQVRVVHAGVFTDENLNLISLGLMFEAEGLRFLNTGDGEKINERAMLDSGRDLSCDVFMAAHHGSISTSNTAAFVEAASPAIVVVSCGADNGYGHPHEGALENYAAVGALVLRTDTDGSVVVHPAEDGTLAWGTVQRQKAA